MDMIFTIGIFTSLFFFVLLLNKKNKSLSDTILSVWMLVIGIHLTSTYLYFKGFWEIYPHLIGITVPFPFFYGALLYLYVLYSIRGDRKLRPKDYLHFLPVLLTYTYMFKFYFFYSAEEKLLVDKGLVDDFGFFSNAVLIAIIVSALVYTLLAYRLLNAHRAMLENNFSNTENINLNWLRGFIWAVGIIFITVVVVLLSRDGLGIEFSFNPEITFYSLIVFAILCLGYFGIRHENIFADHPLVDYGSKSTTPYKKSGLSDEVAADKHKALIQLMVDQKPYLQADLTLSALAEKLGFSLHHLSQIINQFEGQNFNDFVNKYRVEEFIQRASSQKHFNFLAHALDSGFNSKSTFNAVFRKQKGMTPSQFMAKMQKNAS